MFVHQVRESEDFYNLSKDKLLELILSDELEIEDEQVSGPVLVGLIHSLFSNDFTLNSSLIC